MPDKHEVGGSTPLEPTKAARAARRKKRRGSIRKLIRSISKKAERDSTPLEPPKQRELRLEPTGGKLPLG